RPRSLPSLHSFPTRRSSDLRPTQVWNLQLFQSINHIHSYSTGVINLSVAFAYIKAAVNALTQMFREVAINILADFGLTQIGMEKDRKSTRLNSSHLVISYAV